jgi:oligopeptide/dipeptide ABC transporter ATP-binding protein
MVFQDSRTALSPVLSVGTHLRSTLSAATGRKPTTEVMAGMLARVGISAPEQRLRQYPHQLSGGIRQRVAIALALAWQPRLLIADEPTTALDVTVQRQVVELLEELQHTTGMAILFVSHDLGVVTQLCETIAVMYAGRIVERGPAAVLVEKPEHPYTEGLLRALPQGPGSRQLESIPGAPPTLGDRPDGCPFHPRCPAAMDRCRTERPPLAARTDAQGEVACWLRHP